MSYGRPQSKSPYGDTDFTDDSLPQQATTSSLSSQLPFQSQSYAPQSEDQPHQYSINAARTGDSDRFAERPESEITKLAKSITQEDILFIRRWQQESYFKRVLPLTAAGSGILYFYNKQRNLPHKFKHYLALAFVSFIVGKWSYRGVFKKRLMESQLNTPYIQALRKAIGLPPVVANSDFDNTTGFASSNYSFEDPSKSFSGIESQQLPGGNLHPDHANQPANMDYQGLDIGKPVTSYEELRAKNRGYTR